ncbi:ribosomal L27 protein-domain-containing protein [Ochromonadaceae sp. CCMP2298]|nr:ribosomal L27 protein-domain-containing protein [Ochromonadaceae sp. CCMP2298]|mmetsp:Transcript_33411/g.73601  ORF Transcript_33411/g.73601 Transcript_33411/m.73601 type:complete len:146 (-) Transcript_33411:139-576(-)|eukprot:CAMPEP_0173203456 /NCGR_PEP_ID=MMETSP1141-20130122/19526_1 /TAXON_ID=483371 /ORGANISM="non described non described, Strain CCMP2298" /LENGTH=145 /DNA_ID=CAMNT_0014128909 /DNA_START=79 /DNA_END=516 /DNA_ORIENTATION=+
MFSRLGSFASQSLRSPINSISINSINKVASSLQAIRFATKKAGGSTKNGRDSAGKRLGVKKFGGEYVIPGNIIIRQRGRKYHEGDNVKIGRDHTIYSIVEGFVKFKYNRLKKRQVVSVQFENPNLPKGTIPNPPKNPPQVIQAAS